MWEPRRLTTLWDFMACYRDSFALILSLPLQIINVAFLLNFYYLNEVRFYWSCCIQNIDILAFILLFHTKKSKYVYMYALCTRVLICLTQNEDPV
jgi:hypothetical protein